MDARSTLRATLLLLALSPQAQGDAIDECLSASERGQKERKEGRWKRARTSFEDCSREVCPREVRKDCHGWLDEVAARMPSLVFRARDRRGNDLQDVRVWIDDQLELERIDGKAIAIDPGPHKLRLERGKAQVILEVVVVEIEKARLVEVTLEEPPEAPAAASSSMPLPVPSAPRPPGRSIPTASYVLSGVGVLGVVGFAWLGLRAQGEVDAMRSSCAPVCPSSRVDDARRDALVANLSLGVGAVALGAAAILWTTSSPEPSAQVWISPGLLGGGWSGRF